MVHVLHVDAQSRVADLSVGQGCPVCGGPCSVRTTPHGAWSYCAHCRRLSPARLTRIPGGLQLMQPVAVA